MINDLSLTLKEILTQPGLPKELALAEAHIAFERPVESFSPTETTIDLFLYDLRENFSLRGSELTTALACTYLVTAWPVGGPDLALKEQQLLGEVLWVLSGHPSIPANFLHGSLAGQAPLPQLHVLHPDALKNTSEFWTSLGNKLRPSLSVTATIVVPKFQTATVPGS